MVDLTSPCLLVLCLNCGLQWPCQHLTMPALTVPTL